MVTGELPSIQREVEHHSEGVHIFPWEAIFLGGYIFGKLEVDRYERSKHGNIGMNPTRRALFNECGIDSVSPIYGDLEIQSTETQVVEYGRAKSVAHFIG